MRRRFLLLVQLLLGLGGLFAALGMHRVPPDQLAVKAGVAVTFGPGVYPSIPLKDTWGAVPLHGLVRFGPGGEAPLAHGDRLAQVGVLWRRVPCRADRALDVAPIAAGLTAALEEAAADPARFESLALTSAGEASLALEVTDVELLALAPRDANAAVLAARARLARQREATLTALESDRAALAAAARETATAAARQEAEWDGKHQALEEAHRLALLKGEAEAEAYVIRQAAVGDALERRLMAQAQSVTGQALAQAERQQIAALSGPGASLLTALEALERLELGPVQLKGEGPDLWRRFGELKAWSEWLMGQDAAP